MTQPPAQASDEPMRAAPELTKDVVDSVQWMTGAPDVGDIPQPYAGAIVLLETFASIGMTARRDGQPTSNSLLCTKFANDLRLATKPSATADVERDAERYRFLRDSVADTSPWTPHGAVWVVRYNHPVGQIPSLQSAGKGAALDLNVDAAIDATKGAKP